MSRWCGRGRPRARGGLASEGVFTPSVRVVAVVRGVAKGLSAPWPEGPAAAPVARGGRVGSPPSAVASVDGWLGHPWCWRGGWIRGREEERKRGREEQEPRGSASPSNSKHHPKTSNKSRTQHPRTPKKMAGVWTKMFPAGLLTQAGGKKAPASEVLANKKFVVLYFSASVRARWSWGAGGVTWAGVCAHGSGGCVCTPGGSPRGDRDTARRPPFGPHSAPF